jgi:uncharacterized membrane protein
MLLKIRQLLINEPILLAGILLLATLLRIYRLGDGLWFDEIITYINYGNLPFKEIATTFNSENNHVLYSLFAHASLLIFGQSGWALRLPAVIFGVGSLFALFLLGRLVANRREALLAVLFLSVSYHHIWFSQNARGYTALLFWTILSTYFLIRSLNENRNGLWVVYGLTAALGMYTHLTMSFILAGQFLGALFQTMRGRSSNGWQKWQGVVIGFTCAGFITLLLYLPLAGKISSAMDATLTGVPAIWNSPVWTILETLKGLRLGYSQAIILVSALSLLITGVIDYFQTKPVLILVFLLPPLIGSVITLAFGHPLWQRFFFFTVGFVSLVVVRGAMVFAKLATSRYKFSPKVAQSLGTLLCLGIILASMSSLRNVYGPKQDYESAMQFIKNQLRNGDSVAMVNLTIPPYRDFFKTDWQAVESLSDLEEIMDQADRTWVVVTFPGVLQTSYPEISNVLLSDFQLVQTFWGTVGDGQVYIYLYDKSHLKENIN